MLPTESVCEKCGAEYEIGEPAAEAPTAARPAPEAAPTAPEAAPEAAPAKKASEGEGSGIECALCGAFEVVGGECGSCGMDQGDDIPF